MGQLAFPAWFDHKYLSSKFRYQSKPDIRLATKTPPERGSQRRGKWYGPAALSPSMADTCPARKKKAVQQIREPALSRSGVGQFFRF